MPEYINVYLPAGIAVLLVLNIFIVLIRTGGMARAHRQLEEEIEDKLGRLEERITRETAAGITDIRRDLDARLSYDADENRKNRAEIAENLSNNQERLESMLRKSLNEMQENNRVKLENIRTDLNAKLDTSLNRRLDESFKNVGDQLNKLYESLGELSKLETGVNTLNRTLSNVKTRGIFGEAQLENILTDILPGTLFDKNVVTRKSGRADNREAVEFAVKIPDKETVGAYMYLPIDSKFPASYYDRIVEASEASDNDALRTAVRELEQRVKADARDIRDKYLDPPHTTDFGIMFLPTESLYAEVLRISGLVETCQSEYHVVITGPSTMAALLNSLSIGFRYMAVNRDSKKILKLLSAVKTQYASLSRLINTAAARLEGARKANEELQHRADIINKRLSSIEEIDPMEASALLGEEADSRWINDTSGNENDAEAYNAAEGNTPENEYVGAEHVDENQKGEKNGREAKRYDGGFAAGNNDSLSGGQETEDFL